MFLVPYCDIRSISAKNRCSVHLYSHLLYREFMFYLLFVFIYIYLCPTRFPYQTTFVSFNSNTTGVTCGTGTDYHSGAPEIFLGFRGLHVAWSLVFYVMFCRWLFVLLLMAIVLYWLLITPLVSSHLSFSLWSVC